MNGKFIKHASSGKPHGPTTTMEQKTNPTRILLGMGSLSWLGGERRTDRYGTVMLYSEDSQGKSIAPDAHVLPAAVLKAAGSKGKLVCVVLANRESTHIGDLFRGIAPTMPAVGEEITLGEGVLFYDKPADRPIEAIGLKPEDGREHDWLDPNMLYRAHEQTVELYFEPSVTMPKVELSDIRLGVSPLTDTVYAGVLDPKDKTQSTWRHHQDVNADFYRCLVQLLTEQDGAKLELRVKGELRYTITIIDHKP